jgi:hypothetical protein
VSQKTKKRKDLVGDRNPFGDPLWPVRGPVLKRRSRAADCDMGGKKPLLPALSGA